jgi:Tol biopolymer transport system component
VVFVSARSGKPDLWLADREGGDLRRLTSLGAAAVSNPRWSPRGNRIAFNALVDGRNEIMLVHLRGGEPRRLENAGGRDVFSNWCADGEHLLISADRGQGWQIYRQSSAGGPGTALTSAGGMFAAESPDGMTLYFTRPGISGLWRMELGETNSPGKPEMVIPDLLPQDRRNWRLAGSGKAVDSIAWVMRVQEGAFLMFHDLETGESSFLSELPGLAGAGLAVSPSGNEIIYAWTENMSADLMLLEGALP